MRAASARLIARFRLAVGAGLISLAGLLFASCAPAPAVLLSPEAASLRSAIEATVPKGTLVLVEGQLPASQSVPRNVVRVGSTPGWNLPTGIGPASAIPSNWADVAHYAIPKAIEALGKRADGSWSAVPLLFDIVGTTVFVTDAKGSLPPADWATLSAKAVRGSIVVAGSRPSLRQTAYFFGSMPPLRTRARPTSGSHSQRAVGPILSLLCRPSSFHALSCPMHGITREPIP